MPTDDLLDQLLAEPSESGTVQLSRAQLSMLLEGIDWRRVERTWTPEIAV